MRFLYAWKNQVLYKTVGTIKYIVANNNVVLALYSPVSSFKIIVNGLTRCTSQK